MVPLNQDFFVSFGKTVLKPEEVVVSVFIPFSKKVKLVFSSATNNCDDILTPLEMTDIDMLRPRVTLELFSSQGELVRAFRHAPRKEGSFATVTTGMRALFAEGSNVVRDISIYYGGMGATIVSAAKTCSVFMMRLVVFDH